MANQPTGLTLPRAHGTNTTALYKERFFGSGEAAWRSFLERAGCLVKVMQVIHPKPYSRGFWVGSGPSGLQADLGHVWVPGLGRIHYNPP